jgi:magnesium transporter
MQLKALIRPTEKILYENDTIKDAKEKINKYRLYDLPVISNDGKFLGSLSSFDLTGRKPNFQNTIENEVIFKILGIDIQAIKESTLFLQLLKRSACLTANVLGGIICAMILFLAGGSLKEILALTLFMPVLLTITEAISGQTVAMSIDSMSKKEPDETDMPNHRNNLTWSTWKKLYRTVTLESLMGAAIGLAVGVSALILAAFVEYLFKFKSGIDIYFSIIFLGTVVAGGLFAAFIGFLTPKLLDRYIPTWVAPLANPLSLAASDIATIITYIVFIICFT